MAEEDYAIVVGITRYPHLGNLGGCENDARNLHTYLTKHSDDKVPPEHAKLIVSSQFASNSDEGDANATRPMLQEVEAELRKLVDLAYKGKVGRRLWLFMAGHGLAPELRDAALLMANADDRTRYHLAGQPNADWFCAAAAFDEVILLMDCCRDDYPDVRVHPPYWGEVKRPGTNVDYLYGYATKWSRKAREDLLPKPFSSGDENETPAQEVQGLFTHTLLEGLCGKAYDPNDPSRRITGASLKNYVHNKLHTLTVNGKVQYAEFAGDQLERIVFSKGGALILTHVRVRFQTPPTTRLELYDSPSHLMRSYEPQELQLSPEGVWTTQLERGFYKLLLSQSGRKAMFEVNAEEVLDVQFPD